MIEIKTNAKEIAEKLQAFKTTATLVEWIDSATPTVVEALKAEAPVGPSREGQPHLRDRIFGERASSIGKVVGIFETDRTPVADFVLGGTKPHEIRPKGPWPLRFDWPKAGGEVESWGWHGERFGVVHHPGTKANLFNLRAWLGAEEIVMGELVETLEVNLRG